MMTYAKKRGGRPRSPRSLVAFVGILVAWSPALAAPKRVAVTGNLPAWCDFLITHGYECENIPATGPVGTLDGYDVILITLSNWSDPDGLLADFMRAGKGVITGGSAPQALGIDSDPTVQGWIGANIFTVGQLSLHTIRQDFLLGSTPVGTLLVANGFAEVPALADTTGHPNVVVLARWLNGTGQIGMLRNEWETGRSVYLNIGPSAGNSVHQLIFLNAVRWAAGDLVIPATSTWGVIALTLLLASAGTVLVRRRARAWVQ